MAGLPWHHYHLAYVVTEPTSDITEGWLDGHIWPTEGDARLFGDVNPVFEHDAIVLGCNQRACSSWSESTS